VARSDRASASPSQRTKSSERTHSSTGVVSSWVPSTLSDDALSSRSPGKGDSSCKRTHSSERAYSSERIHSRERTRASALNEEEDARCERRVRVPPLQEEEEEEDETEEESVVEKERVRGADTRGGGRRRRRRRRRRHASSKLRGARQCSKCARWGGGGGA